jgi:hypothetical protein
MIDFGSLNYFAIFVATLVSFFLGFIWYTVLFSKQWMTALGVKPEDVSGSGISMSKAMSGSILASLATALGLALLYSGAKPVTWQTGLLVAGLVWAAFSMGPMFKMIFWEDRPVTLLAIDGGYEFVSIFAAAAIIIAWN